MNELREKLYDTWHKNYHDRIDREYRRRMERAFFLNHAIKDLEFSGSRNFVTLVRLTLAKKTLHLYNSFCLCLLKLHCVEIDVMDGFVKMN